MFWILCCSWQIRSCGYLFVFSPCSCWELCSWGDLLVISPRCFWEPRSYGYSFFEYPVVAPGSSAVAAIYLYSRPVAAESPAVMVMHYFFNPPLVAPRELQGYAIFVFFSVGSPLNQDSYFSYFCALRICVQTALAASPFTWPFWAIYIFGLRTALLQYSHIMMLSTVCGALLLRSFFRWLLLKKNIECPTRARSTPFSYWCASRTLRACCYWPPFPLRHPFPIQVLSTYSMFF